MKAFKTIKARAAYLDRPNVDTDLIIPKQFLKRITKEGFGEFLFNDLRYTPEGKPNPDFLLNKSRYKWAGVLVGRENFGCGSSREHAGWALMDYGFKAIIAPSFGDIFKNNSFKIGLLLIELPSEVVSDLMRRIEAQKGYKLEVNLKKETLVGSDGWTREFKVNPFLKERFLTGGDEIDLTLRTKLKKIEAYESSRQELWEAVLPPWTPGPLPEDEGPAEEPEEGPEEGPEA
jgi:3-isopropylmalate/(R)-2-methylmalate dehydratase small subunit